MLRRPAVAPAAGCGVMVDAVLELTIEALRVVAGSRALVTVHRVAEHDSKGQTSPPSAHGDVARQKPWTSGREACSAAAEAQTAA